MEVVPILPMVMVAVLTAAIGSAFGLKGRFNLQEFGSKATEHVLDHVIGPDEKRILSNLRRKMAISEMPSEAHELTAIHVPDLDKWFGSGSDPEPVAVIKLQPIAISHCDCLGEVEKNILSVVRR